ncbi:MAG: oligosaccharide flippase family protein [Acidiferrobacterales bacterium]|nr:oligosaccharide flippase family protein [Acidiferrobacterales bacterium]
MSSVTPKDIVQQLVRGGGLSILIKVANAGLAYVMLLILARVTTAEQYGIFAVAFSVALAMCFVSIIGQQHTILRFWPQWMSQKESSKARAALKLSMILTAAGLALTAVLMVLGGALNVFEDSHWSMGVLGATALFGFAMGWSEFSAAGMRAQEYVVRAQAPRDIGWRVLVCLTFGAAAIAGMSFDAITIVLAVAVMLLVMVLPQTLVLIRSVRGTSLKHLLVEDRALFRRFTLNMWAMGALGAARNYAGVIIVSTFLGSEAAGAYFVADRTANILAFLLLAINLVAAPLISKYHYSNRLDMVRIIVGISGIVGGLSSLFGFLFFVFFGREILALFKPEYVSYLPVLLILAFGQFVRTATGPSGLVLMMAGHERLNLVLLVVIAPVSLVLQVLGGLYFGPIGVASAMSGGIICCRLASTYYAWRRVGVDSTGISFLIDSIRLRGKILRET